MSGGEESDRVSPGDTVNDAMAGVFSMLVERLLRRTGRGTSTLGFKDCSVCVCVCVCEREGERDGDRTSFRK